MPSHFAVPQLPRSPLWTVGRGNCQNFWKWQNLGRNPACISSPFNPEAVYWVLFLEHSITRVSVRFSCQNKYLMILILCEILIFALQSSAESAQVCKQAAKYWLCLQWSLIGCDSLENIWSIKEESLWAILTGQKVLLDHTGCSCCGMPIFETPVSVVWVIQR